MAGGTAESMFTCWFSHVGWPVGIRSSLGDGDAGVPGVTGDNTGDQYVDRATRESFVKELTQLKDTCMMEVLEDRKFELVPGFLEFLDQAAEKGDGNSRILLVLDSRKAWNNDEDLYNAYVNALKSKLSHLEASNSVQFVDPDSERWNIIPKAADDGIDNFDEKMAELVNKHKARVANFAASSLKDVMVVLSGSGTTNNSNVLTPSIISAMTVLELGLHPSSCVFLASTSSTIKAANASNCARIYGIRGPTTRGAQFPSFVRTCNGYGKAITV